MNNNPDSRFRIRFFLLALILATIPCYCSGLALVQLVDQEVTRSTPTPPWLTTQMLTALAASPTASPTLFIPSPFPTSTPTLTAVNTPTATATLVPIPTNTPVPSPTVTPTWTLPPIVVPTDTATSFPYPFPTETQAIPPTAGP
jgi:hypothetical protein